ncbi:AraC family transcriptional regulator [Streptomyces sp. NPDC126514]|uniref:AraC family transcriptional regulator n=1 Tax=Streptomyces sp. NPDC126514 TaxID=3155210 RepID=UPI00332C6CF2
MPFADVRHLWDRALSSRQDAGVGLRLGIGLRPPALHVLGHLILTSPTLGDAAAAAVRYHRLVSEAGEVVFSRGATRSHISYRPAVAPAAMLPQQVEAIVAGMVAAARWLAGPDWAPAAASFTHQPICDRALYEEVLGCPVTFAASGNALTVPTAELDRPYATTDPELAVLQRGYADRLLADLTAPPGVDEQIRRWLARAPLDKVSLADVREAHHWSDRSLRRALRDRGTSWRALLNEARHARACHLLETTDLTTASIAHAVGLGGAAALSHAFRRWQGVSPGEYRRTCRAGLLQSSHTP